MRKFRNGFLQWLLGFGLVFLNQFFWSCIFLVFHVSGSVAGGARGAVLHQAAWSTLALSGSCSSISEVPFMNRPRKTCISLRA